MTHTDHPIEHRKTPVRRAALCAVLAANLATFGGAVHAAADGAQVGQPAPDFTAVGGYDGMAAIVHAVQATKGKMDGDDAVKSLLGWKFDSPQGPIMIDPETRDIIMNEYLSEVVKGPDGKLHEKQLAVVDSVKDQCKVLALGPCAPKK